LPDGPERVVYGSGIDKGVCVWRQEVRHRINGDMVRSDLAHAAQWLPQVVDVTFLDYDLVVADYAVWKQKVFQRQQAGGGMP
jgi:hypothetical protein